MSERHAPPVMFFEPRGSYARTWQCRWRRIKCALGFHTWWLGPYAAGDPPYTYRDVVTGEPVKAPNHTPEYCGGGSPWCQAWRLTPTERWKPPRWFTRAEALRRRRPDDR